MMNQLARFSVVILASVALWGCKETGSENSSPAATPGSRPSHSSTSPADTQATDMSTAVAVAKIEGAGDNKDKIHGTVTFTQLDQGVKVVADIDGLSPGKHGIHVHDKADLSAADLKGAGPHFNPGGADHKHAGPEDASRHAGDLGNIEADQNGHGHLELTDDQLSVTKGDNKVVGHSVIIHAKEDDLKSQPAGNSGDRIAGGVIELQQGAQ